MLLGNVAEKFVALQIRHTRALSASRQTPRTNFLEDLLDPSEFCRCVNALHVTPSRSRAADLMTTSTGIDDGFSGRLLSVLNGIISGRFTPPPARSSPRAARANKPLKIINPHQRESTPSRGSFASFRAFCSFRLGKTELGMKVTHLLELPEGRKTVGAVGWSRREGWMRKRRKEVATRGGESSRVGKAGRKSEGRPPSSPL